MSPPTEVGAADLLVRGELHRRGLRFRVDRSVPELGSRRRVDVVFPGRRVAVFVDGCFWHGCRAHGTRPSTHPGWWAQKILHNQRRDADSTAVLRAAGWEVLRFWEHDPTCVAEVAARAVRARAPARRRAGPGARATTTRQ